MAKNNKNKKDNLRPPIVTILGHVDHGKTTLLDHIRKTRVQQKEAGGITQAIGASVVETKDNKKITFVDTPGHAAFKNMRSRGATVADIAILVVAADDGVKPQTKEALEYILNSDIPFIVAATKTDLKTASVDKVRGDLEKEQVLFEGRGGEVPLVAVSGKTGEGVDDLLEMIELVSELNEIKGSEKENFEAFVIETSKDRRGPLASVVIKKGKLSVGDELVTESVETKVRGLFNWMGKSVKEVLPGDPVQILGFSELPEVGSRVWRSAEVKGEIKIKEEKPVKLEVSESEIPIVVKAGNAGSLEAIKNNLPENVVVIHSGVGDVNESDVFMAKPADASILAFEVNVPSRIKKLAQTEDIKIESFKIIYKLFERLEDELRKEEEKIVGEAKVLDTFPFNKKTVAGCKVMKGQIPRTNPVKITRGEKDLGTVKITSMKRGKEDIQVAKQGEECGLIFSPQLDFKVGDVVKSLRD